MTAPQLADTLYILETCIERYIADRHARVDAFVHRHFSIWDTLALQRRSFFRDLLCYPLNALWAIPHLFLKKALEVPEKLGWHRGSEWSARLPNGFTTRYQREIEWLILTDLLEWPCVYDSRHSTANALGMMIAQHPKAVGALAEQGLLPESLVAMTDVRTLVSSHGASRAFITDTAATLLTVGTGWYVFGDHSLTLSGMGDRVARNLARERAVSSFALGPTLGSAYYSFFPPKASPMQALAITVAIGAAITVTSLLLGLLSDPLRKWIGLQQLHLHALIDHVEDHLFRQLRKHVKPALVPRAA